MEKYAMLALSTGHITEGTANLLNITNIDGIVVYNKDDFGYFMTDPENVALDDDRDDIPADLRECLTFAHKHNCEWVMFDRDVEPIAELPVYEW